MFQLIVLYSGDVEFVKLCVNEEHARAELADWICDNWHDEETCYEDFGTDDLIEWYFEHYEDYSYYRQPVTLPKMPERPEGEEILLTPGMCAIVRNGVAQVSYQAAHELLLENDEIEMDGEGEQAVKAITAILDQFE